MALEMDDRGIIVACPGCGRRNRLPFGAAEARCGGCRTALPTPDEPIDIPSASAWKALITTTPLPVVVDFWAPWCGPCHMVAPELQRVAAANRGRYLVVKINTDALPELGEQFRIRSIPTMAVFRDGQEVGRTTGARPAQDIEAFVARVVS